MTSEARRKIGWGVAGAALLVRLAFLALRVFDGPPPIEGGSRSAAVEDLAPASDAAIEAERVDELATDAASLPPPAVARDREPSPATWRAIDVLVKRATGAPVAGAAIRLQPTESFCAIASPLVGATDVSGELRLEAVSGASYDLAATIGTTTLRRIRITAPARVVIELPQLLVWRVRVEERSGLPVAGALVGVGRPGSKLDPIRATTDRSGVAALDLPVDTAKRFTFVRAPDGRHAELETPSPLRDGMETRVVLGDLVRITGRVRHRDGAIPADGRFEFGEGRAPVALAPDGSFEFAIGERSTEHALLRGSRFVDRAFTIDWERIEAQGAWRGSMIDVGELTVDASRLLQVSSIDGDERPVEGVVVRATGPTGQSAPFSASLLLAGRSETMLFDQSYATDVAGHAEFELPAGEWVALELNHPGCATWRTTVSLDREPVAPVVARLMARAFLAVDVVAPAGVDLPATTRVSIRSLQDEAAIKHRSRSPRPEWFDRDTAYVDAIPAGAYELVLVGPGHQDYRAEIEVGPGRTTVRAVLATGVLIEGTVVRANGDAAAGVEVSLYESLASGASPRSWSTRTTAEGRFEFRSAPAAARALRLHAWEPDPVSRAVAAAVEREVAAAGSYELRLQPVAKQSTPPDRQ